MCVRACVCVCVCAAYKRILVHNEIMNTLRGNCLSLESVPILTASSINRNSTALQNINDSVSKQRVLDDIHEPNSDEEDDEYIYIPSKNHLSKCSDKIVAYIAGFVVFKLKKSLHCEVCIEALNVEGANNRHSLIKLKTKSRLVYPSDDVIDICVSYEKKIREITACIKTLGKSNFHRIVGSLLADYRDKNIFSQLNYHMYDTQPLDNHLHLLVKAIAETYLQVRYSYASKQITNKINSQVAAKSRQIHTKLIHFSGQ